MHLLTPTASHQRPSSEFESDKSVCLGGSVPGTFITVVLVLLHTGLSSIFPRLSKHHYIKLVIAKDFY